jgi:acetyl esterase/lipase
MVIHGGGWTQQGPAAVAAMAPQVQRFRAWGYPARAITYGPGRQGLSDVLGIIDRFRAAHPRRRICLYGESAGGHLALLAAQRRAAIDCVIALGAPTDLVALAAPHQTLRSLVLWYFGDALGEYSPARHRGLRARVLLAYKRDDTVVPLEQGLQMRSVARRAVFNVLEPGPMKWIHGTVSRASTKRLARRVRRFLRE